MKIFRLLLTSTTYKPNVAKFYEIGIIVSKLEQHLLQSIEQKLQHFGEVQIQNHNPLQ